jgi:putative transposase
MPRISRGLANDCIYHVINRGNGGQVVFQKDKDYEVFVSLLKEAKIRYAVKVFAYCLMPTHFHMVVMPHQSEDLSKLMQWILTSHVRRFHKHYGTSGHIWQGRYKSFLIQKDRHLLTVLKYVESNPLRAGLVSSARSWSWSSHRESIHKGGHLLIDEVPLELPKEWSKFVNESISEKELEKLRQSVSRQSPYGDSSWQVHVSKTFGLESTIRPRGRPRKED